MFRNAIIKKNNDERDNNINNIKDIWHLSNCMKSINIAEFDMIHIYIYIYIYIYLFIYLFILSRS